MPFGQANSVEPIMREGRGAKDEISKARATGRISPYDYAVGFMLIDALIFFGSGVFAGAIIVDSRSSSGVLADWQWWAIALAIIFHVGVARLLDVYSTTHILNRRRAIKRVALSLASSFLALLVIAVATKTSGNYSRLWFFSWLLLSLMLIVSSRFVILGRAKRLLARGAFVYKALSIGISCDPLAPEIVARRTGGEVRAVEGLRLEAVGELSVLSDKIIRDEVDWLYLAAPWADIPNVLRETHLLRHLSTRVFVLPGDRTTGLNLEGLSFLGDRPLFCAMEEPIHGWNLWWKRAEDIGIAVIAVVVLSPLMALIALAIRLDSPGAILFRQPRAGFNGKTFELWKFRSMFTEATDLHASVQTSRGDPRVTRVGRFLRRSSLDELPQFFNVLQGTMSVVGPRPHALSTRTLGRDLDDLVDYYASRHRVRPGITGWAQIHGLRGELDTIEKLRKRVDFDIEYIDRWSFWLDLRIVLMTAAMTLRDANAY